MTHHAATQDPHDLAYDASMQRLESVKNEIKTLYNKKWDYSLDTEDTNIISSEKVVAPRASTRFNTKNNCRKAPKFAEADTSF